MLNLMQASIGLHEIELTTSRASRELRENRLFTGELGQTRLKPLVVELVGSQCHLANMEPVSTALHLANASEYLSSW